MLLYPPIFENADTNGNITGLSASILDHFFVQRGCTSDTLSPGSIITGQTYYYNMLCGTGLQFGQYVPTHEKTDNITNTRTVSAITLRPTANLNGSFYYYSMATGRRLIRRRCTSISIPDEIIDRVHYIAKKQKCPD